MAIKTVGELTDALRGFDPDVQVVVAHPEFVVAHQTEDCDGYCGVDIGEGCAKATPSLDVVEVHFGVEVQAVVRNAKTSVWVTYRDGGRAQRVGRGL